MMRGSWDMDRNREFFVILDRFLSFYPSDNLENQNFEEKNNKTAGDIIILHMCTINDNHVMYDSWNMEPDGKTFLSFWTNFLPFYLLTTQQIKILRIIKISGHSVHWGINPCQPPSFLKLW